VLFFHFTALWCSSDCAVPCWLSKGLLERALGWVSEEGMGLAHFSQQSLSRHSLACQDRNFAGRAFRVRVLRINSCTLLRRGAGRRCVRAAVASRHSYASLPRISGSVEQRRGGQGLASGSAIARVLLSLLFADGRSNACYKTSRYAVLVLSGALNAKNAAATRCAHRVFAYIAFCAVINSAISTTRTPLTVYLAHQYERDRFCT